MSSKLLWLAVGRKLTLGLCRTTTVLLVNRILVQIRPACCGASAITSPGEAGSNLALLWASQHSVTTPASPMPQA